MEPDFRGHLSLTRLAHYLADSTAADVKNCVIRLCETDMASAEKPPPEKMMFQLNLRRRGISNQAVLRAMEAIPRELFVEP